jgi:hypothetical protein
MNAGGAAGGGEATGTEYTLQGKEKLSNSYLREFLR